MPNDTRDKLATMVKDAVHGCARRWAEIIAEHLIDNGVTVQEWISVEERLPEDYNERVLVRIKDGNNIIGHPDMDTDRYVVDSWVRWGKNVTHWMPLPEPPKGD